MPSPTEFHRFLEFPIEIQAQVWRYTATPRDILDPTIFLILNIIKQPNPGLEPTFIRYISQPKLMYYWIQQIRWPAGSATQAIARARRVMMATCCTARHVALQTWKRDVESIQINRSTVWGVSISEENIRDVKGQIISLLDDLIRRVLTQESEP